MSKKRWLAASLVVDAILINVAIVAAFVIRFGGPPPARNFAAYTSLAIFITATQLVLLYVYDVYNAEEVGGSWETSSAVVKAVSLGILVTVFLSFFTRFFAFPRLVLALSWILQVTLLSGWRVLAARVLKISWPAQRVLVVGTGEAAREVVRELKKRSQWGYELVGLVDRDEARLGTEVDGATIIGTTAELASIVEREAVDRVIVASVTRHREVLEDLAGVTDGAVRVEVIPDLYEIFIGKVDHTLVSDIPLVELSKQPAAAWVHSAKRLIDVVLALLTLLVSSPAILVAVLGIKLTSRGPVVYQQDRVGQNEKVFKLYKFRTMVQSAETETGPVLASENDERVTPVGRFLRKFRIDELPQLVNVLKGEMSFVGPRPERAFFVQKYKETIPGYAERFRIKPGLTGLAQISGGYATSIRNKLKYDLIYIYHQSLPLDAKIMLRTIKVLLTGRGAR